MQKTETAGATDGAGAKVWCWGCNLRCWGWSPSSPSAGYGPASALTFDRSFQNFPAHTAHFNSSSLHSIKIIG